MYLREQLYYNITALYYVLAETAMLYTTTSPPYQMYLQKQLYYNITTLPYYIFIPASTATLRHHDPF